MATISLSIIHTGLDCTDYTCIHHAYNIDARNIYAEHKYKTKYQVNLNISSLVQPSIAIHGVRQQDHIV